MPALARLFPSGAGLRIYARLPFAGGPDRRGGDGSGCDAARSRQAVIVVDGWSSDGLDAGAAEGESAISSTTD